MAKAIVRKKTAPIRRPWSKDDVRVLKSMARKEPVAKNAKALKRTDEATPQKAIVIGLSPKLAPEKRASAKKAEAKQVVDPPTSWSTWRHQTFAPPLLPVAERGYATHRTIGDVEATREFHPVAADAPSTSSRLRASANLVSISRATSR